MNTGKWVKFYQNVICFLKTWFWIGQYDLFHTIFDKFYFVFKEFCRLWVLSPRIWNVLLVRFSKMNLLHQLKRKERWPRNTQKVFFGWKLLNPNTCDCPLNSTLNAWYLRFPSGSEVSRRFCNILRENVLVRIRSNYFCHFFMVLYCKITRKVLGRLFSIKVNISFIYWYCTLCSF